MDVGQSRDPHTVAWKARELMAEENGAAYDPKVVGLSIFGLENAFDDRLCDGDLKREFYERSLHFIGSESPKSGASSYGLPVDRAHARLWLWLKMWAGY